jgi:rhodanese-related sulfurtransferase
MPKKSRKTHRSKTSAASAFVRRPIVQIGILVIVAVIIYLIAVTAAPGGGKNAALPAEISVSEAYSMYQDGAYVVDVREPSEWDEYHAPNTHLIPINELESRLSEIPRDTPILVVCRSGNRSDDGRDILLRAGFTQVTSMAGGLNAWRDAGYPIEP